MEVSDTCRHSVHVGTYTESHYPPSLSKQNSPWAYHCIGRVLIAGGESNPGTGWEAAAPPPFLAALHLSTELLKGTGNSEGFFFSYFVLFWYFFYTAKFWRNEFISPLCCGLVEMKYNGGGPGAWWGDVSTEGKLLFVCLSLTLGLPFISLQGCGAVFTPGQLFSASPSALSPPPPFHAVFKSITGWSSRIAIETFKPPFLCT